MRFARKGANMDTIASQALNDLHCLEMTGKAKKRRAAEYRKARSFQRSIEPPPIRLKTDRRPGKPTRVTERGLADP